MTTLLFAGFAQVNIILGKIILLLPNICTGLSSYFCLRFNAPTFFSRLNGLERVRASVGVHNVSSDCVNLGADILIYGCIFCSIICFYSWPSRRKFMLQSLDWFIVSIIDMDNLQKS